MAKVLMCKSAHVAPMFEQLRDSGRSKLVALAMPLSLVGSFGELGGSFDKLKKPRDIIELPEGGGFIVSDAGNNKLTKFNADGSVAAGFFGVCGYGYGATNCIEPSGLAMYGDELFVVDEGNARIQVYSVADGAFVRTIFLPEGKPDDTNKWYPKGVALHAEKKDGTPDLFVLEVAISGIEFSSRVQVLNISSGRPNRSFDVPKDVFNPGPSSLGLSGYAHGLAVAGRPLNAVIVGDMIGSSIGVVPHNKGPSLVGGITNPFGFAIYVDRKNADNMKVYVSSLEGGTVHILSPAGEGALKADEKFKIDGASGLTGLRLSADGTKLYACDQGAGCVWILSTVEEAAAA